MINREKFSQTAGSVLKHAMCSKREGSEALYGRNQLGVGPYSVAVHAAQPAGQPRARTIVLRMMAVGGQVHVWAAALWCYLSC